MLCLAHLGKSLVLTDLSILISLECTPDDICVPCRKLVETARHAHEKRTLSFCACIRTRVVQVNPFEASKSLHKSSEHDILLMIFHFGIPPPHALGSVLENTGKLALRTITLSSRSQITWNLPALVLELVEWLNNPQFSTTSKVGLLSSPSFLDLVEPYVGAEISISFQRMLYAESLAYTQPTSDEKHHLSIPEL
jgi:hypothetical protein